MLVVFPPAMKAHFPEFYVTGLAIDVSGELGQGKLLVPLAKLK